MIKSNSVSVPCRRGRRKCVLFFFAAAIFSVCIFSSCEIHSETKIVYTEGTSRFEDFIEDNYSVLDERVYKYTSGDTTKWIKFFCSDGELKMFKPSPSSMGSGLMTEDELKDLSYENLKAKDHDGEAGYVVAIHVFPSAPNGGTMLLLKAESHKNDYDGYCYEDPSIKTEVHENCYIPFYLAVKSRAVVQCDYFSSSVHNDGVRGTSCFAEEETALEYLQYESSSYEAKLRYNLVR